MSCSTPVAFLIFRRPDLTATVFEAIRRAQPAKLLVIADGPQGEEDIELCLQTRAVVEKVDWKCEVLRNYSEANLGCKKRVSSGLDWVFSQVEEAIILEDDCLPSPSFFQFCQTLLEKYRHDERIMMISGDNFQPKGMKVENSYYFSKYVHIWGWATWRRSWQHYDLEMISWEKFRDAGLLHAVNQDPAEAKYWLDIFNAVASGTVNTWAYQWVYACWQQSGMSITPTVNLVSNLGFRDDATHTLGESPLANIPVGNIHNIIHPDFIVNNIEADTYSFENVLGGKDLKNKKITFRKIMHFVRKVRGKVLRKWSFQN